MPTDLHTRDLIAGQPTALLTVAATMRNVYENLLATGGLDVDRERAIVTELDELEACCRRAIPVHQTLISAELSPRAFMALMINTLVRVLPTYAEIPLNLAVHGIHGDLRNYGLIALNVADEAGGGDPAKTHPTLFNRSAAVLATIFSVAPLTIRVGLAALALRSAEDQPPDRDAAFALVEPTLRQDEWGRRLAAGEIDEAFERALLYAPLIADESLRCYTWRMNTLADMVSVQLRTCPPPHDAYATLVSLLAVREAAASDPAGIFCALSTMIMRYGGHLGLDVDLVRQALDWSDVHVDEALGEQAGYDGHSVEDDHAEQALGAVLDRVYDDHDLLAAITAMNDINRHRMSLWQGTLRVMREQHDEPVPACAIPAEVYEQVRRQRVRCVA